MAKIKVDFSGVEDKKDVSEITKGKYLVEVDKVDVEEGSEYPYLKWSLKIKQGACKGLHVSHITSFKPNNLWKLRDTLEALGFKVPKSTLNLDPDICIGRMMVVDVYISDKGYPEVKKTTRPVKKSSDEDDE